MKYKVYISYIDNDKVNQRVVFLGNGLAVPPIYTIPLNLNLKHRRIKVLSFPIDFPDGILEMRLGMAAEFGCTTAPHCRVDARKSIPQYTVISPSSLGHRLYWWNNEISVGHAEISPCTRCTDRTSRDCWWIGFEISLGRSPAEYNHTLSVPRNCP